MRWPRPGLILLLFARASRVQRKRAMLPLAAIAWGSLSLMLMLSFGEGLKRSLWRASRGMGHNLAVMWPGRTGLPWQGLPAGRPIRPKIEDLDLLRGKAIFTSDLRDPVLEVEGPRFEPGRKLVGHRPHAAGRQRRRTRSEAAEEDLHQATRRLTVGVADYATEERPEEALDHTLREATPL